MTRPAKTILMLVSAILVFLLLFPALAEGNKRVYFDDVGVSLEIPESVRYVTQAIDNSGNYFGESYGSDPDNKLIQNARETVRQQMISKNKYIMGILDDGRDSLDVR